MALHEQSVGASDEWYTPSYVFEALGVRFDMDVAHPGLHVVDWVPADRIITGGSLTAEWDGFVWMNAPFGKRNGLEPWLAKFVAHANGIALTPDRTSAPWWQRFAPQMDAILFVAPKIKFIPGPGTQASSPAQGTCLMAIGREAVAALRRASRLGLVLIPSPSIEGVTQQ